MAILVDTGPLLALADASDRHHEAISRFVQGVEEVLVMPVPVLPELCYLVGKHLGAEAEALIVRSIAAGDGGLRMENLASKDLIRAAELISRYSDARIGFVDASLVAVAERLNLRKVLTLDRRHFGAIRPRHCEAFEILP